MDATLVLPGQTLSGAQIPPTKKGALTLGPGLRHVAPSSLISTSAGSLTTDPRKGALWLDAVPGRYLPATGDLVVAQVHHSATDVYYCSVSPHAANAILGHLSFEGASRKTRPQLKSGDLVYARVSRATKGEDVEIECVNPSTGKSDGLGPLKGGMVYHVSSGFARRLMMPGDKGQVKILESLGEKIKFEVAVGRNGIVWIESSNTKSTLAIGSLLVRTHELSWSAEDQKKAVKTVIQALESGS